MKTPLTLDNPFNQIIVSFIISIIVAWAIIFISPKILILITVITLLTIIGVVKYGRKILLNRPPNLIILIYLLIMTSFIGPAFFSVNFGPISLFPYRIFYLASFLLFIWYWYKEKQSSLKWKEIKVKPALLFLLLWLSYGFLTFVWAKSLTAAIKDIIFLFIGVTVIFIITFSFKKLVNFIIFMYIWIAMLIFLLLIGFWNHFTHQHLSVSRINDLPDYYQGIPTSVFGNENDYASFICISIFFVLALIHHKKNKLLQIAGVFLILASLYIMYVTNSRANFLALFLGLVSWFLFALNGKERLRLLYFGCLGVSVGVIIFFNKVQLLALNIFGKVSTLNASSDNSVDIRKNLLRNAVEFIQESYGFGVGSGNAEFYMRTQQIYPTQGFTNVHNWWAEIMLNYGVIIFILYVLLFFYLINRTYRIYKSIKSSNEKMVAEGLLLALITFSLASISPSSIMTLNYNWMLFAFAISFINFYHWNKEHRRT
jgi:teichuronic acid biosynthesis protein TuaE